MQSEPLLAHLASRFVSQRENLATEALAYILGRSHLARSAMVRTFRTLGADLPDELTFRTQAAAPDQTIPDLVGEDSARLQHLVIEAKFWAGLTSAQPVGYLLRIASQGRGTLAFIVPAQRAEVIWHEIVRRCSEAEIFLEEDSHGSSERRFALLKSANCSLGLITWRDLLSNILLEVEVAGEHVIASDVRQLQGLCNREDADAFLPLTSEELTGAGFPKRIIQFSNLVDDLGSRLVALGMADVKGLRTTTGKGRYGRYLRIHNVGCLLYWSAELWGQKAPTPIWLRITSPSWGPDPRITEHITHHSLLAQMEAFPSAEGVDIPVRLPFGKEREQVFEEALDQLKQFVLWLKELSPDSSASAEVGPPPDESDALLVPDPPLSAGGPPPLSD